MPSREYSKKIDVESHAREAAAEHDTVKWAKINGWFVRKAQWVGRRGAPDRIFIKGGRTVWIEFKRVRKGLGALQSREHERMRKVGAEVYRADSFESAKEILENGPPKKRPTV